MFFLKIFIVRCGRRARVGGWRVGAVGAPQLHLICGSVSAPAAGPRPPAVRASDRVRPRPTASERTRPRPSPHRACLPHPAPAVRPPSCMPTRLSSLYSSDTSTQTLKILGSWMYALAYVNCESFSFPFLVGGRVSGRRRRDPAARSRLYLPMCKIP